MSGITIYNADGVKTGQVDIDPAKLDKTVRKALLKEDILERVNDLLEEATKDVTENSHGTITYTRARDNWFVISGFIGERIFYRRSFLSDRSRNRFDAAAGTLSVSRIFDWYRKDFEQGHQGIASLQGHFARHADVLASTPQAQADIRAGRYKLAFLDYDWALNDAR